MWSIKNPTYHFFDEKEKSHFLRLLSGYESGAVSRFISDINLICNRVLCLGVNDEGATYKRPSLFDRNDEIRKTVKQLKKTRRLLERISSRELLPRTKIDLEDLGPLRVKDCPGNDPLDNTIDNTNRKAVSDSFDASKKISELIKAFEEVEKRRGSPGNINEEFARQVAECYRKHIDEPKASTHATFPVTLSYIFEVVGIEIKYHEKLAVKALKNLHTK